MVRFTLFISAVVATLAVVSPVLATDAEAGAALKCPIAEKCPYYDHAKAIVKQPDGESAEHPDCPLKTKGCPYYDQHKGDKKLADALVTENDDCPLAGKCKFYAEIKEGKVDSVNFDKADCPLSGKCPYYEELKKNGTNTAADCPLMHKCPHFSKKDVETQPHPEGHAHGHKHKGQECPFIAKQKAEEKAAAAKLAARDKEEL